VVELLAIRVSRLPILGIQIPVSEAARRSRGNLPDKFSLRMDP